MKTKEFIKKVEGLGYEVADCNFWIDVTDCGITIATVFKEDDRIYLSTINMPLAKLCIEYAETPIAEREEVKKYIVVLPDPRNEESESHMYMLIKRVDGLTIGWCHKSHLKGLTEAEIKRNHSYLWQFAKEVE